MILARKVALKNKYQFDKPFITRKKKDVFFSAPVRRASYKNEILL